MVANVELKHCGCAIIILSCFAVAAVPWCTLSVARPDCLASEKIRRHLHGMQADALFYTAVSSLCPRNTLGRKRKERRHVCAK